eukprot:3629521-Rhodomonas_salina.1
MSTTRSHVILTSCSANAVPSETEAEPTKAAAGFDTRARRGDVRCGIGDVRHWALTSGRTGAGLACNFDKSESETISSVNTPR